MKVTIKRTTTWESMYVLVHFFRTRIMAELSQVQGAGCNGCWMDGLFKEIQLSHEKNLGWLGHIGDENYPLIWVL